MQSQCPATSEKNRTRDLEIRVRAAEGDRFNLKRVAGRAKVNNASIFEVNIGVVHRHAREIRIRDDAFGMEKRAVHRDVAVGVRMPVEVFQVKGREQKGVQVNIPDGDFPTQVVRLAERQSVTAGNFSRGHSGAQFEMCGRAIRLQVAFETADYRLPDAEIHDAESPFAGGRKQRAFRLHPESQLAAHRQTARLQFFKVFKRESGTDEVRREGLRSQAVACRACNDAGAAAALFSRGKESQFRIGDAGLIAREVELPTEAV